MELEGTAGGMDGRCDIRVLPLRKGEDVVLWTGVRWGGGGWGGWSRQAFRRKKDMSKCSEAETQSMCWRNKEQKVMRKGEKEESFMARASNVVLLPIMVFLGIFFGPTVRPGYRTAM